MPLLRVAHQAVPVHLAGPTLLNKKGLRLELSASQKTERFLPPVLHPEALPLKRMRKDRGQVSVQSFLLHCAALIFILVGLGNRRTNPTLTG